MAGGTEIDRHLAPEVYRPFGTDLHRRCSINRHTGRQTDRQSQRRQCRISRQKHNAGLLRQGLLRFWQVKGGQREVSQRARGGQLIGTGNAGLCAQACGVHQPAEVANRQLAVQQLRVSGGGLLPIAQRRVNFTAEQTSLPAAIQQ